jgi:hypothetical protein
MLRRESAFPGKFPDFHALNRTSSLTMLKQINERLVITMSQPGTKTFVRNFFQTQELEFLTIQRYLTYKQKNDTISSTWSYSEHVVHMLKSSEDT